MFEKFKEILVRPERIKELKDKDLPGLGLDFLNLYRLIKQNKSEIDNIKDEAFDDFKQKPSSFWDIVGRSELMLKKWLLILRPVKPKRAWK